MRQLTHRQRGQGLVEFALILPLLLFIVMGIIDFGRVMLVYAMVSNGAREAVRYGSVPGRNRDAGDYNYMHCDEMRNATRAAIPLITLDDADITLTFDHGSGNAQNYAFLCGSVAAPQIAQGDRIVATVQTEIELITPLINNIWPSLPINFVAARTIVKDGIQTGPTQTPWPTRTPAPATDTATPTGGDECRGNPAVCNATNTALALTQAAQPTSNVTSVATATSCNGNHCGQTATSFAATQTSQAQLPTNTPAGPTSTNAPTNTPGGPTSTPAPATDTPRPATSTPVPSATTCNGAHCNQTATAAAATQTGAVPTNTPAATSTSGPTNTPRPPTITPRPATDTPRPTNTSTVRPTNTRTPQATPTSACNGNSGNCNATRTAQATSWMATQTARPPEPQP